MRIRIRSALLIIIFGLAVTGCATNPVTGKTELTLVSEAEEIAIGKKQYLPTQQSQGGQYKVDEALTRYVNEVGNRLAAVSDRPLPYEFVVINDSTPNAWALPGGKMAINRGLLLELENEAELAAVLGHEIVHAAARHGARSMERSMLLQGAVMLTAIGAQDSRYANYIVGGASMGAQLISQKYGRSAELEADKYGMQYMARAGYDPAAAISLQEKFVALKNGKTTSWLQGLFASHPPSPERVAKNRETSSDIKSVQAKDWEIGDSRYGDALAYLSSRQGAYQAFDQAQTLLGNKENAVAMNRVNHAIKQEPGEARFYGLKADILYHQASYKQAIGLYGKALEADSAYYEYYLGRGMSFSKIGNQARARDDLIASNSLLPTAMATNELGSISLAQGDRATAKQYFGQVAQSSGPLSQSARQAYVRLDLPENPAPYFKVTSQRKDGKFYSVVANASGLPVQAGIVQFSIRINGEVKRSQRRIGKMAPGASVGIYPGWSLSEADVVDSVDVRVVRASL